MQRRSVRQSSQLPITSYQLRITVNQPQENYMPLPLERLPEAYRQMLVIRKFEETIRSLYQQGKIRGSFHPCVGQEATAVGGCWAIRRDDPMTCTYRGHGQALAKGLDVGAAMAEMLGKATGCSKGK